MAKDFKDVEVFQISAMITNVNRRKGFTAGSLLSLAGQEAFLSVPSRVYKSTVEWTKAARLLFFRLITGAQAVRE